MSEINTVIQLQELAEMKPAIEAVRTAIKGAYFVKKETYTYLPHPSQVDKTSATQKARYAEYLAGAEFDDFPSQTLASDTGKLKLDQTVIELPNQLDYLEQNADGDGLSLVGLTRSAFRNVASVKWHVLLTDYKGLTDVDIEDLSIDEARNLNIRASIKQYARESVWDYDFQRVDGKLQLTYLVLREVYTNPKRGIGLKIQPDIEVFLMLALDEDGNYYQQKYVRGVGAKGDYQPSERNYVFVNNEPLKFIPVEFACDEEFQSGELPQDLGYLSSICELAYSRYRVSAVYKETMRDLAPTQHIFGVSDADWEFFSNTNGRDYVATGASAVNVWRDTNTKVEIVGADVELEGFERYFDKNESKVRALGGSFETDDNDQETATATAINNYNKTARLSGAVTSIEEAIQRSIAYCGMFEGLYSQDSIEGELDNIAFKLPRDFATARLTADEVRVYMELRASGELPRLELLSILEQGGWTISKAEELIEMSESEPPSIILTFIL